MRTASKAQDSLLSESTIKENETFTPPKSYNFVKDFRSSELFVKICYPGLRADKITKKQILPFNSSKKESRTNNLNRFLEDPNLNIVSPENYTKEFPLLNLSRVSYTLTRYESNIDTQSPELRRLEILNEGKHQFTIYYVIDKSQPEIGQRISNISFYNPSNNHFYPSLEAIATASSRHDIKKIKSELANLELS